MRFHVVLEEAKEGGYVAQCVEIPGAISEGETVADALANVADAIAGVLTVRRLEAKRRVKSSTAAVRKLKTVDVDA